MDLRLAPFSQNSKFFSELPIDTHESVQMVRSAFEPMSCNIARQYRNLLANHWSPKTIIIEESEADFSGISIVTQTEVARPDGALKFKSKLWDDFKIDALSHLNPALKPTKVPDLDRQTINENSN